MTFYRHGKGGTEKVLAMLKGGITSFGVVFTLLLEVLATLKGGHNKFYPILSEGAQKVSDPQFSHSVAPPPPPPRN